MNVISSKCPKCLAFLVLVSANLSLLAQRTETLLYEGWKFSRAEAIEGTAPAQEQYDDSRWQSVRVPHDWAISGPFDKDIDKQVVAIVQNGETEANEKTGRSGALPWIGQAWYRTTFVVDKDCPHAMLNFDGAMSEPEVYVNGTKVGEWKYGYSAFNIDVTPYVHRDGRPNTLAVHLRNVEESSRWYPGAGLYRPVTLITAAACHLCQWGINVVTTRWDSLSSTASVVVSADVEGGNADCVVRLSTCGRIVNVPLTSTGGTAECDRAETELTLTGVQCWSPEHPQLYDLNVSVVDNGGKGNVLDSKTVKYGIRTISVDEERGFALNGVTRKIRGVCLHHDLGIIGAAVNKAALARQLKLLKSMGCDAIRTAHNMPSQWQMELCDSLGLMVMAESFDMWVYPKCKNGYSRFYEQWWQRDLTNLVMANRLHPSIVLWSIGNEVPEQGSAEGNRMARQMQNLMHLLDPTRPVTAGMDRIDNALATGYAQVLDVPGINYRTHRYVAAHEKLRHGFVLGSETASTLSSRGVYKFPVERLDGKAYPDGQCSGYDVEACWWSNVPEEDWLLQDDLPWVIGEFVWTGFDYLGEPTPYDDFWPSRSSYFGIFDLAGLPKDRYYLYRSHWLPEASTLHLVPHWTFPGREGEITPVYCYTNYPLAELFVNGKSQGRIAKRTDVKAGSGKDGRISSIDDPAIDRYRLRWNNVVYQPGELKVVVYDAEGLPVDSQTVSTAGFAKQLKITGDLGASVPSLKADGHDLTFLTVSILDAQGNLVPDADHSLSVSVTGAASFRGICNGDPTGTEVFTHPAMHAFHGQLVIAVQSSGKSGTAKVRVTGKGLKPAVITIPVRN